MEHLKNEEARGDEDWVYREVHPYLNVAREVVYIVRLLTTPPEAAIDNILRHFVESRYGEPSYRVFLERLDAIGEEIEQRNRISKRAGKAVYSYLHPSNIPSSINI